MTSIFLSYDRDDAAKARIIAASLEKAGHSVWWDRHIKGGTQYSKEIEAALKAADAVVVLWSEQSVESAWVRDEAAAGRDSGRLVPVRLDKTEPPLGFRQYQSIDLPRGRMPPATREALLSAVQAVAGAEAPQSAKRKSSGRNMLPLPLSWIAGGLVLAAIIGGLLLWRPWADRDEILLAVGPAGTDVPSQALARDLAIKLGALQSSAMPVRLVEAGDASAKADLAFEAAASGQANATLVLKLARDSSILWSQDFEQPTGKRADLLQQLAYTAARITGCATEGLDGPVRLKPESLKTYLNACAELSEISTQYDEPPVPMLLSVIDASPRFEPAWSKLLLVEAEYVGSMMNAGEVDPRAVAELRGHIADARKINPRMSEVALAEAALLPSRNFAGRTRLVAQAAEQAPDDPEVLMSRAGSLAETGRTREAVEIAGRAAQLAPLSPGVRSNYIALIAYSGAFEAAKRELAKAEKLWPGTESLWDAQYRFHYRYGDPRIALALFDQKSDSGGRVPRLYMAARADPTPAKIEPMLALVRERLQNMENPSAGIGTAILAFAHFNRKEDVFSTLLAWPKPDDIAVIAEVFFRPEFRDIRRDPRFLRIAQRAGLLDYWIKSGEWPDFCFESEFPYDCKTEAAKLAA